MNKNNHSRNNRKKNPTGKKNSQKSKNKDKSAVKDYYKYTGIAAKMGVIIAAGVFGGIKLDEYFGVEKHLFTIFLSLIAMFGAIYSIYRDVK